MCPFFKAPLNRKVSEDGSGDQILGLDEYIKELRRSPISDLMQGCTGHS